MKFLNLRLLYGVLPFVSHLDNKYQFCFSIFLGSKSYNIKLNNEVLRLCSSHSDLLIPLLRAISFSTSHRILKENKIEICTDTKNRFIIDFQKLDFESINLLKLLDMGINYGLSFVNSDEKNKLTIK